MKYYIIIITLVFIQFGCIHSSNSQQHFPPPPEYRISKENIDARIQIADSINVGLLFMSNTDFNEKSRSRIIRFTIHVTEGLEDSVISQSDLYFNETYETIRENILNIDKYDAIEIIFESKEGIIYSGKKEIEN